MTGTEPPIRVLLVEDNDVYRESLVFLVGRLGEIEVVGAVADGRRGRARMAGGRAGRRRPRLPATRRRRRTVAAELRSLTPDAAIVFLSASAGQDEYDAASSAGAALVRKDEGIEALVGAVRAAAGR